MSAWHELPGLGAVPGFLVVFVRLTAFLWAAPLTGEARVPPKARIAVAAILAAAFSNVHPVDADLRIGMQIPLEIGVGLAVGFTARVLLAGLEVGGEFIGIQMGLGFAAAFDPSLGDMALPTRRLAFVVGSFAFVSIGGLHNVARIALLPPVDLTVLFYSYGAIMQAAGEMFLVGMHFALPIMVSVTVANVAMGLANRAAPALNVYSVMLTLTALMGAGVMLLTAPMMASEVMSRASRALTSLPVLP